jgi:hypothetical protein
LSGWIFICLAALDSGNYATKIGMEATIIFLFWVDTIILLYCKTFDNFQKINHYSSFFLFKIVIILLMTIDLIIFISLPCYDSRPIRPFRILRCCMILLIKLCHFYLTLKCENLCFHWLQHIRMCSSISYFSPQSSLAMPCLAIVL